MERRLELYRGRLLQMRGARAGVRFGIGTGVKILYPDFLVVGDDVSIGDHGFMNCLSHISVCIGSRCSLDRNLWLHCGGSGSPNGHGFFSLGDDSYIGCNAVLGSGGGICIGKNVLIGQSVNMHAENHVFADREKPINEQGITYQGIVIEDDVWIGSKVTILDGVTIGRGSVVAAGAVVTRSVPALSVAAGVPARVIRRR